MTNENNIGFLTGFLHAQLITIVFSFVDLSMLITNYLCTPLQIITILVSLAMSLLYVAYKTLGQKCELTLYYERNYLLLKNITNHHDLIRKTFQSMNSRRNDHYIVSAILDLISAILFGASAYTFRHRI